MVYFYGETPDHASEHHMATATTPEMLGILTFDAKGRTTFPLDLRQELGLDDTTQLRVVRAVDGTIELVPAQLVDVDQLWYHSPEGAARIAAAEADFAAGRSTVATGESEVAAHLGRLKARRRRG
jgi:bifunctional DNA-binding transcriptional regulator/antitoxin component of YhaV-PrlF toxin-antitoxin module